MPLWRIASSPEDVETIDPLDLPDAFPCNDTFSSRNAPLKGSETLAACRTPSSPGKQYEPAGRFLVKTQRPPDVNKNTEWFSYPGVWTMYGLIVGLAWLLVLSLLGCSAGTGWTVVCSLHFVVTFYLFHWKKGSPFAEDQGLYDSLTWWEQMDNGRQLTRSRKFLTLVPVFLYVVATYTTRNLDHSKEAFLLNTVIVFTLVIAKMPFLHQVRIFGINGDS